MAASDYELCPICGTKLYYGWDRDDEWRDPCVNLVCRECYNKQTAEIERLRQIIEDAPHGAGCASHSEDYDMPVALPCNCWKSRV